MRTQNFQLCLSVAEFFESDCWEAQYHSQFVSSSWQCLSVDNFLVSGNWEGTTAAQSPIQARIHWQYLSVDSFFSFCSWEGQRIKQKWLDESTWFIQKVSDFARFVPWEGKTEIGALPKWLASKSISVFEVAHALTLTELF
jgi:hypothetical protein